MRTLTHPAVLAPKAGASVALALMTVQLLGLPDALSATFVALVCTSPAVVTGMRRGLEQLLASLAGGIITTVLLEVLPRHPLTLAIALTLTVLMAFSSRLGQAYVVAGFTVLYVYVIPASSPEQALQNRLLSLSVGVVAATIVNLAVGALFSRRVYERRIGIVREGVREAIEGLSRDAREVTKHAQTPKRFDAAFPLIWALGAELTDAETEVRLRPKMRAAIQAMAGEVQALARLLHFAKGLSLHLDASNGPQLADAAKAIEHELRAGEAAFDPGTAEWAGLYRRAREAAREARELDAAAISGR